MIEENQEILARRWPAITTWIEASSDVQLDLAPGPEPSLIVQGIQLASAFAATDEAQLQAQLIPVDATTATIYGLGQGNVARFLLQREALSELRIVLLSRSTASAVLSYVEIFDWLEDARVELIAGSDDLELEVPFAVSPADLRLADQDVWRLRDAVANELAMPFLRKRMRTKDDELAANMEANRAAMAVDENVQVLYSMAHSETIRVAAAGPTLSDHYDVLRRGEATLIAVDAALKPLLEAGIVPDIVVSIDSCRASMLRIFDLQDDHLGSCTLVYFPVLPPDIVQDWPGPRCVALGESERYDRLRDSAPGAELWSNGSVVHPAVDLAARMGARTIELFGADFATPKGQSHVDGMACKITRVVDPTRPQVINGHGEPVLSMRNLLSYLGSLEAYIERSPSIDFVNQSRGGALIRGARYAEEEHAA